MPALADWPQLPLSSLTIWSIPQLFGYLLGSNIHTHYQMYKAAFTSLTLVALLTLLLPTSFAAAVSLHYPKLILIYCVEAFGIVNFIDMYIFVHMCEQ